nr:protein FAR1-related sequence 5-like [Tanacetum cinerariifolium]
MSFKFRSLLTVIKVPRESLLFVITSFSGVVSWEGDGALFEESNQDINYQNNCFQLLDQNPSCMKDGYEYVHGTTENQQRDVNIFIGQDGAINRAIEAVYTKAKDTLCMWRIKEKISSKIPTYFIDSPLFEFMRTTSRSESKNSFFKSFISPRPMLVNFMMSYESIMERKKYRKEALDFKTLDEVPKCETKLAIELYAA